MSKLFLVNSTIDLKNYDDFKQGMQNLVAIEQRENDTFYKNERIYEVPILSDLYSNFGYAEQEISRFIEQNLQNCKQIIEDVVTAKNYCDTINFAFLGINFSNSNLIASLQITNNDRYIWWSNSNLTNFEKFNILIPNSIYPKSFEADFEFLSNETQKAILEKLETLKSRNLESIFTPGFQLLKNVTQDNFRFQLHEFRLSSPVALRIYFSVLKGVVFFGSIENKSNSNQNQDIKSAYEIIKKLIG